MRSNVTGGIILFILGAVIISMGVSEKGKRIFNVLTDGAGSVFGDKTPNDLETKPGDKFGGHSGDPDYKSPAPGQSASAGAYVGEKGAAYVG